MEGVVPVSHYLPAAEPLATGDSSSLESHLNYLVAIDYTPVLHTDDLAELTRRNAQTMVAQLCALPHESTEDGLLVALPPPVKNSAFKMPRMHPVPAARPLTRWEQFAKEKGIQKRKRSRLVWDEHTRDWVPRWGHKGVQQKKALAEAVIEAKGGEYLGRRGRDRGVAKRLKTNPPAKARAAAESTCPFEEEAKEATLRKAKQKLRELRNKMEAETNRRLPAGVLATLASGGESKLGKDGKKAGLKHRRQTKEALQEVLRRAQTSTASFGQFDRLARNEKKEKQKTRTRGVSLSLEEERGKYRRHLKDIMTAAPAEA
ncbi:ribosome biogenesis regulatory protein (rrs1) protein [Besnoitia besnoiti]|uniref:Ribosome biogenesis regulatory protein n=1 Tax=Besnoitia besnoiti TaxID=94643 RepID=A0A2A9ML36_BESBE|nr:ribosome biogenesis regulatory protein (rrs1) protein [Besnoitia besnoiti]PFH36152.1 ribosome biogenesis regulatory protein (rrs1) protein [Besnoitia besnoiti]